MSDVVAAPDRIDSDWGSLFRVKIAVWVTVISLVVGFTTTALAVRAHDRELDKKADRDVIVAKLEAIEKRLGSIEDFQRQQVQAAMQAAAKRTP